MSVRLHCDRCDKDGGDAVLFPTEKHPEVDVRAAQPFMFQLKEGWACMDGKHLCESCTQYIRGEIAKKPPRYQEGENYKELR